MAPKSGPGFEDPTAPASPKAPHSPARSLPTKTSSGKPKSRRASPPLSSPPTASFSPATKTRSSETFALDRKTGKLLWRRESPGHRDEKRNKLNDPARPQPRERRLERLRLLRGLRPRLLHRATARSGGASARPVHQFSRHGRLAGAGRRQGADDLRSGPATPSSLPSIKTPASRSGEWTSDMVHSFSTPIVYRNQAAGRTEIIVPGSYQMTSYDVANGKADLESARPHLPGEVRSGHWRRHPLLQRLGPGRRAERTHRTAGLSKR